jgi:hypothetical protein
MCWGAMMKEYLGYNGTVTICSARRFFFFFFSFIKR